MHNPCSGTLSAEVALFELRRQQSMTVKGAATLTANILSGRPHWVQLLIVGVDDEGGARLFYRFSRRFNL